MLSLENVSTVDLQINQNIQQDLNNLKSTNVESKANNQFNQTSNTLIPAHTPNAPNSCSNSSNTIIPNPAATSTGEVRTCEQHNLELTKIIKHYDELIGNIMVELKLIKAENENLMKRNNEYNSNFNKLQVKFHEIELKSSLDHKKVYNIKIIDKKRIMRTHI